MNKFDFYNIPSGKNSTNSAQLYSSRIIYDVKIDGSDLKKYNSWGSELLYGRVNRKGNSVLIDPKYLYPIANTSDKTLVKPVAMAFNHFYDFYKATERKRVRNSLLYDINVYRAYENVQQKYYKYLEILFKVFSSMQTKKFKNFDQFAESFYHFYKNESLQVITMSTFIASKYSTPLCSGIMVEIAKNDYSNTMDKTKYLKDFNFDFYYESALNYGFKIDSQAPWRLIADLDSPPMKKYIESQEDFSDNIFNSYYKEMYLYDVQFLKDLLILIYKNYAKLYGVCDPFNNDLNTVNNSYDEFYWFKWYLKFKQEEYGKINNITI